MAALDYIDIPPGATRLRSNAKRSSTGGSTASDLRAAPTVFTSLPNPSPPPTPRHRRQMSLAAASSALTSPTLGFIPQLLLSSSFPGIPSGSDDVGGAGVGGVAGQPASQGGAAAGGTPSNPRQKLEPGKYTLLSTKDPLSLPIMTNNFKRFVSKVGPVFWVQDRVEEIILWKRGWKRTCTWMAIYAFLCFYPRCILLLPHAALIAIILATYPYPPSGQPFSLNAANDTVQDTHPQPAAEGSVPWQANIQAIQNLMGAVSDLFTAAEPYVFHFVLSPAHVKETSNRSSSINSPNSASVTSPHAQSFNTSNHNSGSSAPAPSGQPVSPYTPHILAALLLSFPVLAVIVCLPGFPVREVCLVAGLLPFVVTNPYVARLAPFALPLFHRAAPVMLARAQTVQETTAAIFSIVRKERFSRWPKKILAVFSKKSAVGKEAGEVAPSGDSSAPKLKPLSMVIQRIIDDDHLTDKCWNSEMYEVELWENERYGGSSQDSSSQPPPTAATSSSTLWSKSNLRPGERSAWTRGRDGWSGVGAGGMGVNGIEVSGEVSSNLTFSLGPGWAFVETEDWRKDKLGEWSGVGADDDGWVYTNDAWLGPRPAPYSAGGGSVTRRRRWTRRVWYNPDLARQEGA